MFQTQFVETKTKLKYSIIVEQQHSPMFPPRHHWASRLVTIQYNTISFNGTKTPQLTQTQLKITRERKKVKKLNSIAYWKRQEDEYFLSIFMIAEKHKFH